MNQLLNDKKEDFNFLIASRLQEKEIEKEKNLSVIRKCLDDLHQLQRDINIQIEKCLKTQEDEIQKIELSFKQFGESINQLCNQDLDQAIQSYYKLEDELIDFGMIKQMLQENLDKISIRTQIDLIQRYLNDMEQQDQKSEIKFKLENFLYNVRDKPKGKERVCEPHKAQIFMVDLNRSSIIPKRFACSKCYHQNRSRNFIPLDIFQIDVNQFQQRKIFYINSKIQEIENNSLILNNLIKDFRNQTNQEIQNVININQQYKDIYFKFLQSQKLDIILNYCDLSDDQIIEIANQLSNPNSFKLFKQRVDQQYQQFISKSKQLLNNFLKGNQTRTQNLKDPQFQLQNNINKQENRKYQSNQKFFLIIFLPLILGILCIIFLNSSLQSTYNNKPENNEDIKLFIYDGIQQSVSEEQNQIYNNASINFTNDQPKIDIIEEQQQEIKENKTQFEEVQQNQEKKEQFKQEQQQKSFSYELQVSIDQTQWCGAISFSRDSKLMIANSYNEINVFEFKKGIIQTIKYHKDWVTTLYFMKNTNQFISGSADNSIVVWQFGVINNKWEVKQRLNGHSDSITHIIMNDQEDLIISCSSDRSIKFWEKQNNLWQLKQSISDHNKGVFSISINESQNQLISCGQDNQILVIEQQSDDKLWVVKQKINVEQYGFRLSFIGDNQFTFQPNRGKFMHLYEWDDSIQEYVKTNSIKVYNGNAEDQQSFPQKYIKEKSILINKYGRVVNVIYKNENGEFINQQQIEFNNFYLYGQATDNGEYLVTWDWKTSDLQIRQYQQK